MDPYLENQEWDDFHSRFNNAIADALMPQARPRYYVRVERRVYVEHVGEDSGGFRQSDVAIVDRGIDAGHFRQSVSGGVALAPVECLIPVPETRHETYLVIRERETHEVVTVLETLSPSNKRAGGDGRREYLEKREAVHASQAHLVELDLLRGGARLPTVDPLPTGDYYAIVSRRELRPRAQVYCWPLSHPLPEIPVPLLKGDADVSLDLQQVFNSVYDRAGYDLSLNYHAPLAPPARPEDGAWMQELLQRGK